MSILNIIILFIISAAPVVLLGIFIYSKDRNKEPFKLLLKLFLGGIGSCFLTLALTGILGSFIPYISADADNLNLIELIIHVFIGVALIEEFSKWLITYSISYNHNEFDEIYDMVVYGAFAALGFAFFENILYVFQGGIGVGIVRALLAVPGHACDGIAMGYYLGLAKQSQINGRMDLKKKYIAFSILVPTVLHGIYDYCLFSDLLILILFFLVFVILVYIFSLKKVKRMSSVTRKLYYKDKFCGGCGRPVDGNFCPICGRKHN